MAGVKQFSEAEVLEQAMRVFWTRGFEATSLTDLIEATGLNKSSLYNAFGSKEQLFERALRHYESIFRRDLETVLSNPSIKTALEDFFAAYLKQAAKMENPRGCLLTSSCNELDVIPAQTGEKIAALSLNLENLLTERIKRAQTEDQFAKEVKARRLARYLVAVLKGMAVMDKTHRGNRQVLQDVKIVVLQMLKPYLL